MPIVMERTGEQRHDPRRSPHLGTGSLGWPPAVHMVITWNINEISMRWREFSRRKEEEEDYLTRGEIDRSPNILAPVASEGEEEAV